jgi:hypothetical protein
VFIVVVLTYLDRIQRQAFGQLCVDRVDLRTAGAAACDIGLIGDDDQQESLAFQRVKRCQGARRDGEFAELC